MELKSVLLNSEILKDLESGENKYKDINNFIQDKFKIAKEDYSLWLDDSDLRVYKGIDYDVVIDSWFHTQNFYSGNYGLGCDITEKDNTFVINPPNGYEDMYKNDKLEYNKTKDGLIEAFNNTIMSHCIATTTISNDTYYICKSEL